MERDQASFAAGEAQAQGGAAPQGRARMPGGNSFCAAHGLRLEPHPRRTCPQWPDVLEALAGLDCRRHLGTALEDYAAPSWKGRGHRPVPRGGGQRFFSSGFWGAHTGPNPTDRAKNGCKRHLIVDASGVPLALRVTAANVLDGQLAIELLDAIPPVAGALGRPRFRPAIFQGDHGYGWLQNILATRERGVIAQLGRPKDTTHGSGLGRFRVVVEHALAWFNNCRRLRLCYEKCAEHLQGFHDLAACLIVFNRWQASLNE